MTDYATIQARINLGDFDYNNDPRDTRDVRNKLRAEAEAKFSVALAEAYGLTGAVASAVYKYAEQEGHSGGHIEVLNVYDDVAAIAALAAKQGTP